jgi:hypothetical protein
MSGLALMVGLICKMSETPAIEISCLFRPDTAPEA